SRDLGGPGDLSGIGNDVETAFDERFHNARADPLRSSGHDDCLPLATHGSYLENGGHGSGYWTSGTPGWSACTRVNLSRGDKTTMELSMAGIRGLPARLMPLTRASPASVPANVGTG